MKKAINQSRAFLSDYGIVNRSSAVFYFQKTEIHKTYFTILNYWKIKRGIDVLILASIRDMSGNLVKREKISFEDAMVINYEPELNDELKNNFYGSVEIEIFSIENMFIPYPAIIAAYQSEESISMVHSYARYNSSHEIEDGDQISDGVQSAITINLKDDTDTFLVFHNGNNPSPRQICCLEVENHQSKRQNFFFPINSLDKYETKKIYLSEINGLRKFLDNKLGFSNMTMVLNNSILRALCAWESSDKKQLQVTHSDFNYNYYSQESLPEDIECCYAHCIDSEHSSVVIHNDVHDINYTILNQDKQIQMKDGFSAIITDTDGTINLSSTNKIPNRIHTEIVGKLNDSVLPFHCSVGTIHALRPKKRLWWFPVVKNDDLSCKIFIKHVHFLRACTDEDFKFSIALYSSSSNSKIEKTYYKKDLPLFDNGISLEDVFDTCYDFLGGEFGYCTVYCENGSFFIYTLTENKFGSKCVEHGF